MFELHLNESDCANSSKQLIEVGDDILDDTHYGHNRTDGTTRNGRVKKLYNTSIRWQLTYLQILAGHFINCVEEDVAIKSLQYDKAVGSDDILMKERLYI